MFCISKYYICLITMVMIRKHNPEKVTEVKMTASLLEDAILKLKAIVGSAVGVHRDCYSGMLAELS